MKMLHHSLIAVGLLGLILISCDNTPTQPTERNDQSISPRSALSQSAIAVPEHYKEIRRPIRASAFPWETADSTLRQYVRDANGLVSIGIRPVGAELSRTSGVVNSLPGAEMSAALDALNNLGGDIIRVGKRVPMVLLVIPPDLAPEISTLPFVDHITPARPINFEGVSVARHSDVVAASEVTPWGIDKVQGPSAWPISIGANVTIGILDTGMDYEHYVSGPEYSSANVIRCATWFQDKWPACLLGDQGPNSSLDGHGSHVAGIATAPQNGDGVIGVARGASNAIYRICDGSTCADLYAAYALDDFVAQNYPRSIVNMGFTIANAIDDFEKAIASASSAGIMLVGAAGNYSGASGSVGYPANSTEVIAVSGVGSDESFAENYACQGEGILKSSGSGPDIELAAPFEAFSLDIDGGYAHRCGTSQAAPHVAGAAAVAWSAYPTLTASQVRTRLRSSAKDLGAAGKDNQFGHGLVRTYEALRPHIEGSGTLYAGESDTYSHKLTPSGATYQWQWDTGSGWTNLGTAETQHVTAPHGVSELFLRVEISRGTGTIQSYVHRVIVIDNGCEPPAIEC